LRELRDNAAVDELDRLAPAKEKRHEFFPAVVLNLKFSKTKSIDANR